MTDIEGSTPLWELDPEAMSLAVRAHYGLLWGAIDRHGGVRPGEQGEGDSVVAAFAGASDALAAALDAQRRLSRVAWPGGLELRVRMALHTAEAQLRDESNYFGIALCRCARVRALARGGQTLLSRPVHDLIVDGLPDGVTLVDLGMHRLRGLRRQEHVFGLEHSELPVRIEQLGSSEVVSNNLPVRLSSFVGRVGELEDLAGALNSTRVLTLIGAGGCGKTRLAAEAAEAALDAFRDGAWWVELGPLTDPGAIGPALAEAVGVTALAGQPWLDAVIARLAPDRALVVLDNCEHLLEECARTAEKLLSGCPGVKLLATSRAPLAVAGETAWRVPSLSLPAEVLSGRVEVVADSDAVRLFIERALKVQPTFTLNQDNAAAIGRICGELDGVPLAIELAAARVRVLGPGQIAEGLEDRFRLLTGGARSTVPRQQTLRASIDWSHRLLGENERALFRRLAVFAGGFSLDAAEEVCAGDELERDAILDVLTSLVDKSLIVVDEWGVFARYRLLETVRQYALERLTAAGERGVLRDRHRDAYLARAEEIAPRLEAAGESTWLDALDVDAANLAAAIDHAADTDGELAVRLCVALTFWWKLRGLFAQADAAYARALEACSSEPSATRARALWARSYLLTYAGRLDEAAASGLQALEVARAVDDSSTAARALSVLGTTQMYPDPVGARDALEQAREVAHAVGDNFCFVDATLSLAWTLQIQADPGAERLLEEAFELIERRGYTELEAWYWWSIGAVRHTQGRDDEALDLYRRAIEVADAVGEPVSSGVAHAALAILRSDRGDGPAALTELGPIIERSVTSGAGMAIPGLKSAVSYAQASTGQLEQARSSLTVPVEVSAGGGLDGKAWTLTVLARVELSLGELDNAAVHAHAAAEIADGRLGSPRFSADARHVLAAVALARGQPADAERLADEAIRIALEHQLRPALPPLFDVLAQVAATLNNFEDAARILGVAERAYEDLAHVRWKPEQATIEDLREQLRHELGDELLGRSISLGRANAHRLNDPLARSGTRNAPEPRAAGERNATFSDK